jgi:hypothetical protein
MAKRKRERTERRVRERAAQQLVRDRQRLAELSPGGSPARPIEVPTSSVIDGRARSTPCPLCDGALRLDEQTAEKVDGRSLRATHLQCQRCGVKRTLWFVIVGPS